MDISKESIDLGVVVKDGEAALRFYRDVLGLEHVADIPMPPVLPPGTMHRLRCGSSLVKLLAFDDIPPAAGADGVADARGFRYFTITVRGLADAVAAVAAAGYRVVTPPTEVRTGIAIAMVEDPDGNVVELLEQNEGPGGRQP